MGAVNRDTKFLRNETKRNPTILRARRPDNTMRREHQKRDWCMEMREQEVVQEEDR
jgi:hypothetical protein